MGPSPQVNLFDPMTNDIQRPRHGAVCTLMVAFRSWANSLTARTTPRDPKPKSCPERPDSKPSVMEIWHEFLQLILFMTYSMIYEIGINQHYPKFTLLWYSKNMQGLTPKSVETNVSQCAKGPWTLRNTEVSINIPQTYAFSWEGWTFFGDTNVGPGSPICCLNIVFQVVVSIIFLFSPVPGAMIQFDYYFLKGLKPPTIKQHIGFLTSPVFMSELHKVHQQPLKGSLKHPKKVTKNCHEVNLDSPLILGKIPPQPVLNHVFVLMSSGPSSPNT